MKDKPNDDIVEIRTVKNRPKNLRQMWKLPILLIGIINLDWQIHVQAKEDNPSFLIKICYQLGYSVGP